jgi:hypothetical protein
MSMQRIRTPGFVEDIERMESYLGRANYIYDEKYYHSSSSVVWFFQIQEE